MADNNMLPKLESDMQEIEEEEDEDLDSDDDQLDIQSNPNAHQIEANMLERALNGHNNKLRKPYTVSKPRETWTNDEHAKFIEALSRYERDWKRIGAHIGTKTIIQIRSHAQKYFIKMQKMGLDNYIPPPRPKKRARRYDLMEQENALTTPMNATYVSTTERNKQYADAANRLQYTRDSVSYRSLDSSNDINQSSHLSPDSPHALVDRTAHQASVVTASNTLRHPQPTPATIPLASSFDHSQGGQMMHRSAVQPIRMSLAHSAPSSGSSSSHPTAQQASLVMQSSSVQHNSAVAVPALQPVIQQAGLLPAQHHAYATSYHHMAHVPQMMTSYMQPVMYSHPSHLHPVNRMAYQVSMQQSIHPPVMNPSSIASHSGNTTLQSSQHPTQATMMYQAVPQIMAPYMATSAAPYPQLIYTAPHTPDIMSPSQQNIHHHRESLMSPSLLQSSSSTPALLHPTSSSSGMAPHSVLPPRYSPSTSHLSSQVQNQHSSPTSASGHPSIRPSSSSSSSMVHIRPTPTRPSPIITSMNDGPHVRTNTSSVQQSDIDSDELRDQILAPQRNHVAPGSTRRDSMQVMKDVSLTLVTMRDGFLESRRRDDFEEEADEGGGPHVQSDESPSACQSYSVKSTSSSNIANRKARRVRSRSRSPPPAKPKRSNTTQNRKSTSRAAPVRASRRSTDVASSSSQAVSHDVNTRRDETNEATPRLLSNLITSHSPDLNVHPSIPQNFETSIFYQNYGTAPTLF